MKLVVQRRAISLASGLAAALAVTALPASALTVSVNGAPVTFTPPPIARAGRVFVPLRGVFERLGASVVYEGGVINARGNNRSISLRIGSTTATIDGTPKTIDVAPFIVGASTYVPLRFVSEALGAGVNYDNANQIVALTTSGQTETAASAAPAMTSPTRVLSAWQPDRGATVATTKPTISSTFVNAVDPNSVRLMLDGLDVTNGTTRSSTGFIFAPPSPLQSIRHTVQVTGKLADGRSFDQSWQFTSGSTAPAHTMTLTSPAPGSTVPQSFTVTGITSPNAQVRIIGGATATLAGAFAFGAGNYTGDTVADGAGRFSQSVNLQTVSGATIGLTVTATDPLTKESTQKKLSLRAQ